MTPTIAVDALFSGHHPEDVLDGAALDLLHFEFFPHSDADPNFLPPFFNRHRGFVRMHSHDQRRRNRPSISASRRTSRSTLMFSCFPSYCFNPLELQ
jgi:hypothetical protein